MSCSAMYHNRSLSWGNLPMCVERKSPSGRLRARLDASAAGLQELELLRRQQQQMVEEAKGLLRGTRPRASTMPDIGEDSTRLRHVREVIVKPHEDGPVHAHGRSASASGDHHHRPNLNRSVYSLDETSDTSLDVSIGGSAMASRRASICGSVSVTSPSPTNESQLEFPGRRLRHKSANDAPLSRGTSGVALKHGCPQDFQDSVTEKLRRFSSRQRSCSFALGERTRGPLFSLPRQDEDVSIDESRPRSASLGCGLFTRSGASSPQWRIAEPGLVPPLVSRSPSVASDVSSACSLGSAASDESYLRPRTLSGSSLTFHFPSPMHAVLMQYERTMVDPGPSPPLSDTEDHSQQEETMVTNVSPDNTTGLTLLGNTTFIRKDSTVTLTSDADETRSVASDCESDPGSVRTLSTDDGLLTNNTITCTSEKHKSVSQNNYLVSNCKATDVKDTIVNKMKVKDLPTILPGTKVLKLLHKDTISAPYSSSMNNRLTHEHEDRESHKNRSFVEEGYFSCPDSPQTWHDVSADHDCSSMPTGGLPTCPELTSRTTPSENRQGPLSHVTNVAGTSCYQDLFPSKYTLRWGRGDYVETVI